MHSDKNPIWKLPASAISLQMALFWGSQWHPNATTLHSNQMVPLGAFRIMDDSRVSSMTGAPCNASGRKSLLTSTLINLGGIAELFARLAPHLTPSSPCQLMGTLGGMLQETDPETLIRGGGMHSLLADRGCAWSYPMNWLLSWSNSPVDPKPNLLMALNLK